MGLHIQELKAQIKSSQTIEQIVSGERQYCDLTQYGLHSELSNLQPDSALLAVAIGALDIVQGLGDLPFPTLKILGFECERILEEYAPLWLENARTEAVNTDSVLELLSTIPDDFGSLIELLHLVSELITETHDIEASLLDILKVQSSSHALIAEEYLDVLSTTDENISDEPLYIEAAHIPNDNIIQFPLNVSA